tara:strand:- start:10237 stop:11517 length:1281 start_codon:yes stop_codon:yes gene_type:complete
MKVYHVGGCVRDILLGLEYNDIDCVVVGSTPEEMLSKDFKQVGSEFPVFLHPVSGDEWALARTEYSTGSGYQDFECSFGKDVTLEDDLLRRDLTVNAIAQCTRSGEIIDFHGGRDDIRNKILRHTSESFRDDPVRVLRLARFYAKFCSEWTIAPETKSLCDEMYASGMLYGLTPERVWKETEKALSTQQPSLFFDFLKDYTCLFPMTKGMENTVEDNPHHPEANVWKHVSMVMEYAAKHFNDPEINWACYTHDFGKDYCYQEHGNGHGHEQEGLPFIEELCNEYKVPNNYRDLSLLVCEHHQKVHSCLGRGTNKGMKAKSIMRLFQQTNALVKPERFEKILKACRADAAGRGANTEQIKEFENKPYLQKEYLLECLEAAMLVNTKEVSLPAIEQGKSGIEIGELIRVARIDAIRGVQYKWKSKENK